MLEEKLTTMTTVVSTTTRGGKKDDVLAKIPTKYSKVEALASAAAPPENELSIFKVAKEILTTVKPGSDITNINLPASVLDPISTLEKTKTSMQRGELIQDICAPNQDGMQRMLNVIRFNLSGLARERFGKKPFNPVLGEIYRCCYVHRGEQAGETLLVAEQVSHHPPISALHLRNDALGFTLNSHLAPDSRFWGNSLEVKLAGMIRINLTRYDEEYIITRPDLYITGFIAGRQRIEFNGIATFECKKTGLGAEIDYKAKGAMTYRTEMNGLQGRIYDLKNGNKTLYTFEGHWDKTVTLTNVTTGKNSVLFDYEATVLEKSMVPITPCTKTLEESFSTVVWKDCSSAIVAGETLTANSEKRKVEDYQRQLRKDQATKKVALQHWYFRKRNENDVQQGWDLRADLKSNKQLVQVDIGEAQLKALRSGKLVEQMLEKMATEEEESSKAEASSRKSLFRRKLLSRR